MTLLTDDVADAASQCCAVHRSIKKFTNEYKEKKYPIHVLLNNAAIQSPKGKRGAKTEDGFEVCPATLLHPDHSLQYGHSILQHIHASHVNSIGVVYWLLLSLPHLQQWSHFKCLSCSMAKPLSDSLRPGL